MSRIVGGLSGLLEDVGAGAVALVTAVLAGAVGVVATMHLSGGTPYTQDDLDRASRIAAAQAPAAPAPEPAAEVDPDADLLAAQEEELEQARQRAQRLQRQSDQWEAKWTAAAGRVERLREQVASLREAQEGAIGPDGFPLVGQAGEPGTAGDTGATEVTATGVLTTTWRLPAELKPWPARCGVPEDTYAVRVLDPTGGTVTTAGITGTTMRQREVERGVLTLVCELAYETTVPLPVLPSYTFQVVDAGAPKVPLYTAVVAGPVLAGGSAPGLAVSYAPEGGA